MGLVGIKLSGMIQLRAAMKKTGADLGQLKAINLAAAQAVLPAARKLTPSSGQPGGGRLAASVRAGATQRAAIIRAGSKALPFAGRVHFGLPRGFRDSDGRNFQASAGHPWLIQAVKNTDPYWQAVYWQHLKKIIDQIPERFNS